MSDDDTRGSRSRITCDTSRINVLIEELELRFDSAKAGRYDDAAKLACISTMTDSEVIKKLVRGWMKFGIPIGGGRKVAWRHATWREGVDALRLHFPPEDTEQEAATELSCYKQNQRLDPHVFEWMHLREAAGDVIDPESQNKLINDSFIQTLPTAEDMNELCSHHEGDNPHDIIAEEVASGQLKRFKHIVKRCQQLDKTYHGRAIKAKVVGAAYWSPNSARKKRRGPSGISALGLADHEDADVAEISADFNRVVRLEQKVSDMEAVFNKYQTASTSAAETHKADADRRLSILEGKADVTHDVCVKTLTSLTQLTHQMSQQQPVSNQTATYPQPSVSAPIPMIPSGPAPQFQAPQFQGQTQQAPWNAYQPQQQQQQQYQAPSQWVLERSMASVFLSAHAIWSEVCQRGFLQVLPAHTRTYSDG